MQEEALEQQIQDVQDHLKVLLQQEERGPDHPAEQSRSIENVSVALEELSVAAEEIRQQNEELLMMRDVVETERQRYRELLDFAPDGYLVTDSKGVIQEANTAAAVLRDISRLKEAEADKERRNQELHILSRRLVEVQEAERRHIARELHDEMGQTLTGLKMLLLAVCDLPGVEEDGRMQTAQTMIDGLMDQVQNLSLPLR